MDKSDQPNDKDDKIVGAQKVDSVAAQRVRKAEEEKAKATSEKIIKKERFWERLSSFSMILWVLFFVVALLSWAVFASNRESLRNNTLSRLSSIELPLDLDEISDGKPFPADVSPLASRKEGAEVLWRNSDFLTEKNGLDIPKRGPNGAPAFSAYRTPSPGGAGTTGVNIIITELGFDETTTGWAIALPPEVTLGFSPYAPDLQEKIARARAAGHEVLLTLPGKRNDGTQLQDAGPLALTVQASSQLQKDQLYKLLGAASGYVGIAANLGNFFPNNVDQVIALGKELNSIGLMLVDTGLLEARRRVQLRVMTKLQSLFVAPEREILEPATEEDVIATLRQVALKSTKRAEPLVLKIIAYPNLIAYLQKYLAESSINLSPLTRRAKFH